MRFHSTLACNRLQNLHSLNDFRQTTKLVRILVLILNPLFAAIRLFSTVFIVIQFYLVPFFNVVSKMNHLSVFTGGAVKHIMSMLWIAFNSLDKKMDGKLVTDEKHFCPKQTNTLRKHSLFALCHALCIRQNVDLLFVFLLPTTQNAGILICYRQFRVGAHDSDELKG